MVTSDFWNMKSSSSKLCTARVQKSNGIKLFDILTPLATSFFIHSPLSFDKPSVIRYQLLITFENGAFCTTIDNNSNNVLNSDNSTSVAVGPYPLSYLSFLLAPTPSGHHDSRRAKKENRDDDW